MSSSPPEPDLPPASTDPLTPVRVRALADRSARRGLTTGFQALLVAVIEALSALPAEARSAERAALSLAQQERMALLAREMEATLDALRAGLTEQGRHLLPADRRLAERLRTALRPRRDGPLPAWSDACAGVAGHLTQTAAHLDALVSAQPPDSSSFLLGAQVIARLRVHHGVLRDLLPPEGAV